MARTKEDLNLPVDESDLHINLTETTATNSGAAPANQFTQPAQAVPQPTQTAPQQQHLSPSVYWAQTDRLITLKVDLKDSKNASADFSPKSIHFKAHGYGARGVNEYKFELRLYGLIDSDESFFRVHDNKIEFQIRKLEAGFWPRLVATPQKPHWLKVDFDRWRTEEEMLEDEQPRDVIQDYEEEYHRLQKHEIGYIKESTKKVYMVFYNLAMLVGYLYVLVVMSILYYRDGTDCMPKTYGAVGNAFKFCQMLQYLEVLHPIFGYTKGGPLVPFLQTSGRNFILFIMIELEPRMQVKPVVFYLFAIWSLVEIFRYPFYLTQVLRRPQGLITWLRYTVWIPLYPMGIICEGIVILRNIPYFEETQRLTVDMPNRWNITFDMVLFLKIYLMLLIIPGSYVVMSHMAKQRAKKLGRPAKSKRGHRD